MARRVLSRTGLLEERHCQPNPAGDENDESGGEGEDEEPAGRHRTVTLPPVRSAHDITLVRLRPAHRPRQESGR